MERITTKHKYKSHNITIYHEDWAIAEIDGAPKRANVPHAIEPTADKALTEIKRLIDRSIHYNGN